MFRSRYFLLLSACLGMLLALLFQRCAGIFDIPEPDTPPPRLSALSPARGGVGTVVTITGTRLDAQRAGELVVRFGKGLATQVTSVSDTVIRAIVPDSASTGPITVVVKGKAVEGLFFWFLPSPITSDVLAIADFTPKQGPVGTAITITGTHFGTNPAAVVVRFNGVQAINPQVTPTSIVVAVPTGATTSKITVTVGGQTATSAQNFVVTETEPAGWRMTRAPGEYRTSFTTTLLPNGKVLLAGGYNGYSVNSCLLYDPATEQWSSTGVLPEPRSGHVAVQLGNGKTLVIGGYIYINSNSLQTNTCRLYDPATGTWSATGSMAVTRSDYQAVVLANGKVLVAGGRVEQNNQSFASRSSELYDPATGQWSRAGDMIAGRAGFTLTLLANGRVLATGGVNGGSVLSSCELFDPVSGTWTSTNPLDYSRYDHQAVRLADGRVLVVNGTDYLRREMQPRLYNPATGTWSSAGTLVNESTRMGVVRLLNGEILRVNSNQTCDLYDPTTGQFKAAAPTVNPYSSSLMLNLLPDGKVLLIGNNDGPPTTAELYIP